MIDDLLVISCSGGRSSGLMTLELMGDPVIRDSSIVCFANTGKENKQTLDFVLRLSCYLYKRHKKNVVWLEYCPLRGYKVVNYANASRNGEPFAALIRKRKFVPNVVTRFCTTELKIRVIKKYIMSLGYEYWTSIIGIRYDEPKRWSKPKKVNDRWEIDMPMVRWKITKADVAAYWQCMPFDLEIENDYDGNCDLCHLKGINKKKMIIRSRPEVAKWWIEMERLTGGTFRKEYSVDQLVQMVNSELPFLDFDDTIDCFCNTD